MQTRPVLTFNAPLLVDSYKSQEKQLEELRQALHNRMPSDDKVLDYKKEAYLSYQIKKYQDAINYCHRDLESVVGQKDPQTYYLLASASFAINDIQGAEIAITKAIELGMDKSLAYNLWGLIELEKKNYPAAESHLKEAWKNAKYNSAYETMHYLNLSKTYDLMGKEDQAFLYAIYALNDYMHEEKSSVMRVSTFLRFIQPLPFKIAKAILEEALKEKNKIDVNFKPFGTDQIKNALTQLEKEQEQFIYAQKLVKEGVLYYEAEAIYFNLIDSCSKTRGYDFVSQLYQQHAELCKKLGLNERARVSYQRLVQVQPNNDELRYELIQLEMEMGKIVYSEADATLNLMIERARKTGVNADKYLLQRIKLNYDNEYYLKAATELTQLIEKISEPEHDQHYIDLLILRGVAYWRDERKIDAIVDFKNALDCKRMRKSREETFLTILYEVDYMGRIELFQYMKNKFAYSYDQHSQSLQRLFQKKYAEIKQYLVENKFIKAREELTKLIQFKDNIVGIVPAHVVNNLYFPELKEMYELRGRLRILTQFESENAMGDYALAIEMLLLALPAKSDKKSAALTYIQNLPKEVAIPLLSALIRGVNPIANIFSIIGIKSKDKIISQMHTTLINEPKNKNNSYYNLRAEQVLNRGYKARKSDYPYLIYLISDVLTNESKIDNGIKIKLYIMRARFYKTVNKLEDAKKDLEIAKHLSPEDVYIANEFASVNRACERLNNPIAYIENLEKMCKKNEWEKERALEDVTSLIQKFESENKNSDLDKKNLNALYRFRAYLYIGMNEYQEEYNKGIEDATRALQYSPNDEISLYRRAQAYNGLNEAQNYDVAMKDIEASLTLQRLGGFHNTELHWRSLNIKSMLFYKKGETHQSLQCMDEAIRINKDHENENIPATTALYVNRSFNHDKLGNHQLALEDAKYALYLHIKNAIDTDKSVFDYFHQYTNHLTPSTRFALYKDAYNAKSKIGKLIDIHDKKNKKKIEKYLIDSTLVTIINLSNKKKFQNIVNIVNKIENDLNGFSTELTNKYEIYYARAHAYYDSDQKEMALREFERTILMQTSSIFSTQERKEAAFNLIKKLPEAIATELFIKSTSSDTDIGKLFHAREYLLENREILDKIDKEIKGKSPYSRENVDRVYFRAREYSQENNPAAALATLNELPNLKYIRDKDLFLKVSKFKLWLELELKKYQQVYLSSNELFKLLPNDVELLDRHANACFGLHKYSEAVQSATKAIKLITSFSLFTKSMVSSPFICRAKAFQNLGKIPEAIKDYAEGLRRELSCYKSEERAKSFIATINTLPDEIALPLLNQALSSKTELGKLLPTSKQLIQEQITIKQNINAAIDRAVECARAGDIKKAEFDLNTLLSICERNASIGTKEILSKLYKALSFIYCDNQNDKAIEFCNKLLQLNPNEKVAYINRAYSNFELGNKDQAMADIKAAIELDPNFAPAYMTRAKFYKKIGERGAATADIETYLTLKLKLSKNDSEAKEILFKTIKSEHSVIARHLISIAGSKRHDLGKIINGRFRNELKEEFEYRVNPGFYIAEAEKLVRKRKFKPALEIIEKLQGYAEVDDDQTRLANLQILHAEIHFYDKNYAKFLEEINTFEKHSKIDDTTRLMRAQALQHEKKFLDALSDYNTLCSANPSKVEFYFQRGKILYQLGRYEEASNDFQSLIGNNNKNADYFYHLALTLSKMGDKEGAKQNFINAFKLVSESNDKQAIINMWNNFNQSADQIDKCQILNELLYDSNSYKKFVSVNKLSQKELAWLLYNGELAIVEDAIKKQNFEQASYSLTNIINLFTTRREYFSVSTRLRIHGLCAVVNSKLNSLKGEVQSHFYILFEKLRANLSYEKRTDLLLNYVKDLSHEVAIKILQAAVNSDCTFGEIVESNKSTSFFSIPAIFKKLSSKKSKDEYEKLKMALNEEINIRKAYIQSLNEKKSQLVNQSVSSTAQVLSAPVNTKSSEKTAGFEVVLMPNNTQQVETSGEIKGDQIQIEYPSDQAHQDAFAIYRQLKQNQEKIEAEIAEQRRLRPILDMTTEEIIEISNTNPVTTIPSVNQLGFFTEKVLQPEIMHHSNDVEMETIKAEVVVEKSEIKVNEVNEKEIKDKNDEVVKPVVTSEELKAKPSNTGFYSKAQLLTQLNQLKPVPSHSLDNVDELIPEFIEREVEQADGTIMIIKEYKRK